MKFFGIGSALIAALVTITSAAPTQFVNDPDTIKFYITAPLANNIYSAGDVIASEWINGEPGPFTLELLKGNNAASMQDTRIPFKHTDGSSGSYKWQIPNDMPDGMYAFHYVFNGGESYSPRFKITAVNTAVDTKQQQQQQQQRTTSTTSSNPQQQQRITGNTDNDAQQQQQQQQRTTSTTSSNPQQQQRTTGNTDSDAQQQQQQQQQRTTSTTSSNPQQQQRTTGNTDSDTKQQQQQQHATGNSRNNAQQQPNEATQPRVKVYNTSNGSNVRLNTGADTAPSSSNPNGTRNSHNQLPPQTVADESHAAGSSSTFSEASERAPQ